MTPIDNMIVKKTATLTWPIDAFLQIKTFEESPEFVLPNSHPNVREDTFSLDLCANNKLFNMYHVLLSLYYNEDESELFRYRVSILDAKGQKQCTKEFVWNYVGPDYDSNYNTTNYVPLDTCKEFLVNGRLTLYCEVDFLDTKQYKQQTESLGKLSQNQQTLLKSVKFSDFTVQIGDKQFQVHKNILATRSPVFSAMFANDKAQEVKEGRVVIEDIEVEVFELMLRYIYTGKIESLDEYAAELFTAAVRYQLDNLKSVCEQSLISTLKTESVTSVFLLSDMHNAAQLKSKCIEYMIKHSNEVMQTEAWKQLINEKRLDLIVELFKSAANKWY